MVQYLNNGIIVDLDIVPGRIPPIIHISQYDIGRPIIANMKCEGNDFTPWDTTLGAAFEAIFGSGSSSLGITEVKLEGTIHGIGFSVDAQVNENDNSQLISTITESMTAMAGKARCKFKITHSSGQIHSEPFILDVDRAGVEADTVANMPGFEGQIQDAVDNWMDEHDIHAPELVATIIDGDTLYVDGMEVIANYDEEEF